MRNGLIAFCLTAFFFHGNLLAEPASPGEAEARVAVGQAVEVVKDQAVLRSGPSSDDERLTPVTAGVGFRIVKLSPNRDWAQVEPTAGWILVKNLKPIEASAAIAPTLTTAKVCGRGDRETAIEVSMTAPCAWQIEQDPFRHELLVTFPGARSQMFEINHESRPDGVLQVQRGWKDGMPYLRVDTHSHWGYRTTWDGKKFCLLWKSPPSLKFEGLRICLDAGHGGSDSGTKGHLGSFEKDHNLRVALAVGRLLSQRGVEVIWTRESDKDVASASVTADVELAARVEIARQKQADLFLSIHHNAMADIAKGKLAHGTDAYYFQPHSADLARFIVEPLAKALGEESHSYRWRSLGVIRQTEMPAVLVECNYLSNPELEKGILSEPDYPERAAEAIVEGIGNFLQSRSLGSVDR